MPAPSCHLGLFSFFKLFIYLVYFWVHRVCCRMWAFSITAGGGHSSLRCTGFSLPCLLLFWSTESRHTGFSSCGSWALECRLSSCGTRACSVACGVILDQASNLCPLHWQSESLPLSHQGSPSCGSPFHSLDIPSLFLSQGLCTCHVLHLDSLPLYLTMATPFDILGEATLPKGALSYDFLLYISQHHFLYVFSLISCECSNQIFLVSYCTHRA